MHVRRKGKSGSKKPLAKTPPGWLSYKPAEIETLVVKLAKQGKSASEIGLILRDSYGIPDVKMSVKKRVSQIIAAAGLAHELPEDLQNLIRRVLSIQKHLDANKRDVASKRSFDLTTSKIRRLVKYYLRAGRLPAGWSYDLDKVKLLIK